MKTIGPICVIKRKKGLVATVSEIKGQRGEISLVAEFWRECPKSRSVTPLKSVPRELRDAANEKIEWVKANLMDDEDFDEHTKADSKRPSPANA